MNGKRVFGCVDSGSRISCITPECCNDLNLNIIPVKGLIELAHNDFKVPRIGTVKVHVAVGKFKREVQLEVLRGDYPLLIGLDLFPIFGFKVEGIPTQFPGDGESESSRAERFMLADDLGSGSLDVQFNEADRVDKSTLDEIMAVCKEELEANAAIPTQHFCSHPASLVHLDTGNAKPVYRPQYPVSRKFEPFIDEQVRIWDAEGVTEKTDVANPWNSSLLAVPKRDEHNQFTLARVCIDPRPINLVIEDDERAVPNIESIFSRLEHFEVASELDLKNGYNQFLIAEQDRHKSAFTWKGKRRHFVGAPFGFKHLTSHFQSVMQLIFEDEDFVVVFVDNIIVFSKHKADHAAHLKRAISLLNKYNLKLGIPKCHIGYTRLRMLGHVLSGHTRAPDPDKVREINDFPKPEKVRQLCAFLGMTNFLRIYIPCYSTLAAPLEAARGKNMEAKVPWSARREESFQAFKKILSRAPVLRAPVDGIPFEIWTDASKFGCGAVLLQHVDGEDRFIAFISKSFNVAQRRYSATRRELLGVVFSLKKFRSYLYGTKFKLVTDHRALTYMFTQKILNDMLLNWLDVLLDFDFDIVHRPGILMSLPDALSRLYPDSMQESVRVRRMRGRGAGPGGPNVSIPDAVFGLDEPAVFPERAFAQFVHERFNKQCPEEEERDQLLQQHHLVGHFGADLLFRKIWHAGYFWPGMRKDCAAAVSSCDDCIRYNLGRVGFNPIQSVTARYPFDHIAIDLLSLHKTTPRGNNYILVAVDISTRFVILRSLKDKSAPSVARALWEIVCDFGVPKIMQSDNGSEFVNEVVQALCQLMGVDHRTVAPYNPRANGAAEAHVKVVLNCLRKMCRGNASNFDLYLPAVQAAINTKPAGLHGSMPAELFFGRPVNVFRDYSDVECDPLTEEQMQQRVAVMMDLVHPAVFERSQRKHALVAKRANKQRRATESVYQVGSTVMIKDVVRGSKTEPYWVGPYSILKVTKAGTYTLLDSTGRMLNRTVPKDQVKLVAGPPEPERALELADEQRPDQRSYVVHSILGHRGPEGSREYKVRWRGYDADQDSWEPEAHFEDHNIIQSYWDSLR